MLEALEQLVGARGARRALEQPLQAAEQHEVLAAGEALVERRLLAGERDLLAHGAGLADDVVAADQRAARVGGEQRGEDADGGRLARAVVAEQAEDRARLDRRGRGRRSASVSPKRLARPSVRTAGVRSYGVRS